jgi:hypothetical protein
MEKQIYHPSRFATLFKAVTYLLVIVYLVNCLTPLRLHVDTLRYFAIKDCIELGCPAGSVADLDYLPYGYTFLLIGLSKLGILTSFTIVLINCLYLFGALYLVKKVFGGMTQPFIFFILVLLNWTTIKFIAHPLSEMQYLFFSMASLYFFYRFTKTKQFVHLILAFGSGGLAFITRSVGIALAAALGTGLIWQYRKELLVFIKKHKISVVILVAVAIGTIVFSKQLGLDHYTGVLTKQFEEGLGFGKILEWHFTEWAELTFNTSVVKVLPFLPSGIGKILFVTAGILFFGVFVYLLFFRKSTVPFIVKSYLFFYFILMFNWPFYDPRFWVPVLPLIIAVIVQLPRPANILGKLSYVAAALYIGLGIASIGYMTYTSLNKETFARKQANGVYRNEYETVFFGKPESDTARRVDPVIVNVLERYNK